MTFAVPVTNKLAMFDVPEMLELVVTTFVVVTVLLTKRFTNVAGFVTVNVVMFATTRLDVPVTTRLAAFVVENRLVRPRDTRF